MELQSVLSELKFKTSRSSGAGGQHVNKVESKVMLLWDFENSNNINANEKNSIRRKLKNRIQSNGFLYFEVSESRSQLTNKKIAIDRFQQLIQVALVPDKARVKTKIPRSVVLERLDRKSKKSEKKKSRRWKMD